MSDSRLIVAADNNNEGQVMVDWAQVPDDDIRYDTDDKEEVMRWEEQAWLEAEREKAEAERIVQEAEEQRAHKEEERQEAECKCKAEVGKGSEAGASGEARGEVKWVVMDPGCTCCAWAQTICKFVVDSNKKHIACMQCNQSKGKCHWPGDRKDTKAGPKAIKGKKRKVDEDNAEARCSMQKQAKTSARPTEVLDLNKFEASGSRVKEASTVYPSGLEEKLEQLIDTAGMIANNLAGLFELQEAAVENSGCIADTLESYGYGMAVSPSDSGLSELDSDELHEEAEWLKTHGKDKEEETKGEDEGMAE
ncbi:hypothetical protein M404DRAFT_17544 [Pisolithus tinctorius Marx 270]|uniref:Uncharacterized protein n=1 Tax=Pisolithus tinctorius Marx 270 TaxID=870435 RepID=A0A0C3PYG5_PISTI|nr:hypothetical protein M404DRAFT_17544 [Pisolithus tinctorius Marx 270]